MLITVGGCFPKPRAYSQHQIRRSDLRRKLGVRRDSEVTHITGMEIVEPILAAESRRCCEAVILRKGHDVSDCLRAPSGSAEDHDGAVCVRQHLTQLPQVGSPGM